MGGGTNFTSYEYKPLSLINSFSNLTVGDLIIFIATAVGVSHTLTVVNGAEFVTGDNPFTEGQCAVFRATDTSCRIDNSYDYSAYRCVIILKQ